MQAEPYAALLASKIKNLIKRALCTLSNMLSNVFIQLSALIHFQIRRKRQTKQHNSILS